MRPNTKWIPLFSTNFLGVFNNNFFKSLICFLAIGWVAGKNISISTVIMIANGLYVLPYILFSPLAGRLAKTFEKKRIIIYSRLAEFPLFIVAASGFYFENIYVVMVSIFLIGIISTLFSPAKYGLIRDVGGNKGISFGTGTLEMLTFFGVLLGTLIAAIVSDHYSINILTAIMLFSSLMSLFAISRLKVNETEPMKNCKDTINPLKFAVQSFRWAGSVKGLNLVIFGLSFFWMAGAVLQMNLNDHCLKVLMLSKTQTGLVMTFAAIGIGLGSYITGILSKGKVELGLTPIGGLGMFTNLMLLYTLQPSGILFNVLVFFTAFFCGMYMVPLSSFVQSSIEGRLQGDMIAYSNFTIFFLVFLGSGLYGVIANTFGTNTVFLVLSVLSISIIVLLILKAPNMLDSFKKIAGLKY